MSVILRPQWTTQPQFHCSVNTLDPIFCGGKVEFLHSFVDAVDCTRNGNDVVPNLAQFNFQPNVSGMGLYNPNGSSTVATCTFPKVIALAANESVTLFARFNMLTTDNNGAVIAFRDSGGTPIIGLYIGRNGVNNNDDGKFCPLCRDDASSLTNQTSTGAALNDGKDHTVAVRRFGGSWQYSIDGSAWANYATNPTNAQGSITPAAAYMSYFGDIKNGSAYTLGGTIYFGGMVRGSLTDNAILALHQNPWQVFAPLRPLIWAPSSGGGDVTVNATGNAASFASGSLTPEIDVTLTGNAGTFAIGTLSPTTGGDVTVTATGNAATFAAGSLVPEIDLTLTGNALTFAAGVLTPELDFTLSGNSGTFSGGALAPQISVTLNGNAATFAIGTLTPTGGTTPTFSANANLYLGIGSNLSIELGLPRLPNWNTAGRPSPAKNFVYGFNTDTSTLEMWNGAAWVGTLLS